jgi:hypothetical protein
VKCGEISPGGQIQEEIATTSQTGGVYRGNLIEISCHFLAAGCISEIRKKTTLGNYWDL